MNNEALEKLANETAGFVRRVIEDAAILSQLASAQQDKEKIKAARCGLELIRDFPKAQPDAAGIMAGIAKGVLHEL